MAMGKIFNVTSIKVAVFVVFLFILSVFLPRLFLEEARAGETKYWQRDISGNFTGFNWCTVQCDPYNEGITNCSQSIISGDTASITCGGTVNFNGNFSVYDFDARGSAVFNHMAGELAVQNEFDSSCSYNLSGGNLSLSGSQSKTIYGGSFNQTGGEVSIEDGTLWLKRDSLYSLEGGSVTGGGKLWINDTSNGGVKFYHLGDEGHATVSVDSVDIQDGEYIVDSSYAELMPSYISVNDDADDVVGKLSIKNSDARIAVKKINFHSGGFYEAVPGTTIYFTMQIALYAKIEDAANYSGLENTHFILTGTESIPQVHAAGIDHGCTEEGFVDNFAVYKISVGDTEDDGLKLLINKKSDTQNSLYVHHLYIGPNCELRLGEGVNLYYKQKTVAPGGRIVCGESNKLCDSLSLLQGPFNPTDVPVPEGGKKTVLHFKLTNHSDSDQKATSILTHCSQYKGYGDKEKINGIYLYRDASCSVSNEVLLGSQSGFPDSGTIEFSELEETIAAGNSCCYSIVYELSEDICPCAKYGADISPSDVIMQDAATSEEAVVCGGYVSGSVYRQYPTLSKVSGDNQKQGVEETLKDSFVVKAENMPSTCLSHYRARFWIDASPAGAAGQKLSNEGVESYVDFNDDSGAAEVLTFGDKAGNYSVNSVIEPKDTCPYECPSPSVVAQSFTATAGYELKLSVDPEGAGSVSAKENRDYYGQDENVQLSAIPGHGWEFLEWRLDLTGGANPMNKVMDSDSWVLAGFEEVPPTSNGKQHGKLKDPVNTATGEYYFEVNDLDLGGPIPFGFSRYYGSAVSVRKDVSHAFSHIMGENWLHNYNVKRLYKGDWHSDIIYDRGRIISFKRAQGTPWQLANHEDVPYQLQQGEDGKFYFMDPSKGLIYVFSPALLEKVMDRNGNAHTLSYEDGNLVKVEDELGRSLTFTYEGTQLATVCGLGKCIAFEYENGLMTSAVDAMGNKTEYEYDSQGLMIKTTYPMGNSPCLLTYDDGRLLTQEDAFGNTIDLAFDEANQATITYPDSSQVQHTHADRRLLVGYKDPMDKEVHLAYDADNRRNAVVDRMGDETKMAYHQASGRPVSVTDANGDQLDYAYDAQEQDFGNGVAFTFYNRAAIDYPDETSETFTYDDKGNMLSRVPPSGKSWQYTYNGHGQVLTATNYAGGVVEYAYNDDGTLASTRDSDIGTTTYEYDAYKRLKKCQYPDGKFILTDYNLNDQVVSVTDENNHTTTYAYDANGNRIRVTDPAGNESHYAYDLMDRVHRLTDRLGKVSTFTFDEMGQVSAIDLPDGIATRFGYNLEGWINSTTVGGHSWQTGYDAEGVVSSRTTPLGHTTSYETDKLGNTTVSKNPLNQSTSIAYDAMGRITGVTDALSRTLNFGYDNHGQFSSATMPVVGTAVYTRNGLGLVVGITDLNGEDWTLGYTPMGRLQSSADPLGNRWAYAYDSRARIKKTTFPDGATLTRTYDGVGNVIRKDYSDGTDLQFTYDALDKLLTANGMALTRDAESRVINTEDKGRNFGGTYDDGGNLKTLTYNNDAFTVTFTYDTATGLISRVTDDLTNAWVTFTYDKDHRMTDIHRSNGVSTTYTWDDADRLVRIQDGSFMDINYTLDAVGQVAQIQMTAPLDPSEALISGTDSFSYDAASQISDGGYGHDALGRLIASPNHAFTWDGASRLVGIDDIALSYNGLGFLRTRTESGNTLNYYYNNAIESQPIVAEENDASGQFLRFYIWTPDGRLLYMIDAANANHVYFYHFDSAGSTLALTDAGGNVTDAYAYTPYGRLLAHQGENPQTFTFAGQWGVRQEGVSGNLYHMRARYYDAAAARFLSREPNGMTLEDPRELNPYQYAVQNPMMFVDTNGLRKIKIKLLPENIKKNSKLIKEGFNAQGNSVTKGKGKDLGWLESIAFGVFSQVQGSEEILNIVKGKRESGIGKPDQNLTEWLFELPKYKPPEGALEYWGGGGARDRFAGVFTLGKFGLELSRDLVWWAKGNRESPDKYLGWKMELFHALCEEYIEWPVVNGLIDLCGRVEDGWTRIGEWWAYTSKKIIVETPPYSAGRNLGSPLPESTGIVGSHVSYTNPHTGWTAQY